MDNTETKQTAKAREGSLQRLVRCVNWIWENATIILGVFILATTPMEQSIWLRVWTGCCGWMTVLIMSSHIKNLNAIIKHYEQASNAGTERQEERRQ
jgi:hypothetical protein